MGVYIKSLEMPAEGYIDVRIKCNGTASFAIANNPYIKAVEAVPVPPNGRLRRRIVYRGEVYNALESARVNALDGILSDPYKEGFHDGIKRAIQILANEVDDAPTIISAEEGSDG